MRRVTTNKNYRSLAARGRFNPKNRKRVATSDVSEVGVAVYQAGDKKAIEMKLLVPGRRADSRTTTEFELNGAQARQIYETLAAFYGR